MGDEHFDQSDIDHAIKWYGDDVEPQASSRDRSIEPELQFIRESFIGILLISLSAAGLLGIEAGFLAFFGLYALVVGICVNGWRSRQ